jgi:cytochrome c-type biogenesis protein CcmF
MAVAPALSWRKINASTLWQRLSVPVWVGVLTIVICVAFGLRGLAPLVGFGMGAMAAATAARALLLSVRAARTRHTGWWRGLIGRTNGGMVVHIGVIVMAVGIIAATTYRHQTELALHQGQTATYDGHRFQFLGLRTVNSPSKKADEALIKVDGGGVFTPAVTNFGSALSEVGTPAIDSGFSGDVYLTFDAVGVPGATSGNQPVANLPVGSVAIGVVIEPLLAWLWAGGLLIGMGGVLALIPGTRRRATDPVSAPSAMVSGDDGPAAGSERNGNDTELAPVGVGAPMGHTDASL